MGLDFEGMIADIADAPPGSVILLHGCAHNPTGIDPTKAQWAEIADVVEARGHFAFFDVAYQGFATGSLDEDAYAPRYFESRGMEFMVAQSYSKNLGLYGERVGALNVVAADAEAAGRVLSQLKRLARWVFYLLVVAVCVAPVCALVAWPPIFCAGAPVCAQGDLEQPARARGTHCGRGGGRRGPVWRVAG